MANVVALLFFIFTIILFRPVTGAGIDYLGTVAQTWPTATAYSPLVPQPGPKVTPTARIHRTQLQKRQLANSVCGFYEWSGECGYILFFNFNSSHADKHSQGFPSHAATAYHALPIKRLYLLLHFAQRLAAAAFPIRQPSITGPGHSAAALAVMDNFVGE